MGSTVNNLANSGYYQLSSLTGGQSGSTNTGSTSQTNVTQSLIQALNGGSSINGSSSSNDAYVLSLSPEAQQYLDGTATGNSSASTSNSINIPTLASFLDGGSSSDSGSSSPLTGSTSFLLTTQQQSAITNILDKYKNAPYTQATFDQIQSDLNAAGLGTDTLSAEDQASSFSPTLVLVNDLNGGPVDGSNSGVETSADEQTKSTNYMENIISQWKEISGNTGTSSASGSSSDTQTATAVSPVSSGSGA